MQNTLIGIINDTSVSVKLDQKLCQHAWEVYRNRSSSPTARCSVSCCILNSSATSTIQLTTIIRMPGVRNSDAPAAACM